MVTMWDKVREGDLQLGQGREGYLTAMEQSFLGEEGDLTGLYGLWEMCLFVSL